MNTTKVQKRILGKKKNRMNFHRPKNDFISVIKSQNMSIDITNDGCLFLDIDVSLFEDEKINIDINLELELDYHPDYGFDVKDLKVRFLSAYYNEGCEGVTPTLGEIKEIESYLKENLIIKIN